MSRNTKRTVLGTLCLGWIIISVVAWNPRDSAIRLEPGLINERPDSPQLLMEWEWRIVNDTDEALDLKKIRASCYIRMTGDAARVIPARSSSTFKIQYPLSTRFKRAQGVIMPMNADNEIVARRAFDVELPTRAIIEPPRLALLSSRARKTVEVTMPKGDFAPGSITAEADDVLDLRCRPLSANRWAVDVSAKTAGQKERMETEIQLTWQGGARAMIPVVIETTRNFHPTRFLADGSAGPLVLPIRIRKGTSVSAVACRTLVGGRRVGCKLSEDRTAILVEVPEAPAVDTVLIIEVADEKNRFQDRLEVAVEVI